MLLKKLREKLERRLISGITNRSGFTQVLVGQQEIDYIGGVGVYQTHALQSNFASKSPLIAWGTP